MRWMMAVALASVCVQPAQAQTKAEPRAPAFKKLVDCRAIEDAQARLACYDREVAAVDAAEASKQLVVFDRAQVRRTQRSLFGLSLPDLGLFGGDDEDAVSRIDTTIAGVRQTPYGKWILTLKEGGTWEQIDSRDLPFPPSAGEKVSIRRAALGSFLANVGDQAAIRVRRMR